MKLDSPYEPRPIRLLERAEFDGWRVKVYGISANDERPAEETVTAAKDATLRHLPQPAVTANRYGVGFLIVHEGRDGNYALLDWWFGENLLKNRVYLAPMERPTAFEFAPDGPMACV